MRLRASALAAAAALSLFGGAASAQDAATTDIRCVMVGFMMASSSEPSVKASSAVVTFYFLGRVDARIPAADLEARIIAEAAKMTEAEFQAQAAACGAILTARGASLTAMGERLQKLPQPKAPAS